jgi:ABC-type dipeptide/oligopeptide/nickel transport system ATPase component
MNEAPDTLLSARLTVRYPGKPPVLNGVDLEVASGEILGLVGQSGSGKSTLAMAIMGLLSRKRATAEGSIVFQGTDLLLMRERELRGLRGRALSLVLQSPLSSLNPALRIRTQLKEAWRAHADTGTDVDSAIRSAMNSVSLPADSDFLRKYPAQLSVGQAQRVLIAMAVMHRPALLVADEATSALDVITQSEILELFARLNREIGMSILYISHDLPSVAELCGRIAILHEGQIVECGPTDQIFTAPSHSYTRRLMSSLPRVPARPEQTPKAHATAAGIFTSSGQP